MFAALVRGRSLGDAEDIASVLHHRLNRWLAASGQPSPPGGDAIVGLSPHAVGVTEPGIQRALNDRRGVIERRARELALAAIEGR